MKDRTAEHDGPDLLRRYADGADQKAFAQLVGRHGGWVFSAARRQLGDEHLAEDVTQAVFLLLARRAKRLTGYAHLGGWLFATLGFCVKHARRQRARMQRREQEAAMMRPESVEESSWDEIAPLLETAVGRLGKADRDAVLLRFYEQKPLAEVGRLMGTSEEAAKKRVQRAVEKLRGMLEKQGVTGTAAGLSAVMVGNVVQEVPARVVEGVMSAVGGGGGSVVVAGIAKGAMTTMAWMKAGLVAAASIAALASGVGIVVAARAATPAAAQQLPAPAPSSPAPVAGQLAGVVFDERGRPMPGVLVHVWTWNPGRETQTDQQGRFSLRDLGTDPVEVRFSKEGYGPWYRPDQPTGIADLKVVLSSKTYFEGSVKGPDGKPVKDALVRADCGPKQNPQVQITNVWTETRSGADGRYRLYVAPDRYEIQVRVPGIGAARVPQATIAEGEVKNLDIGLQTGVTFKALVVDGETGKPVANVHLKNWQHKDIEGISDKDGVVTIDGMQPGNFAFTQVEATGYARWWSAQAAKEFERKYVYKGFPQNFDSVSFDLQEGMAPVKIELEREARLLGVVKDPDGKPVAGATVAPAHTGTGNSITGDTRYSVTTRQDGTFEVVLPASHEARYNLVAHDGTYGQWRKWANGVAPPMQTKPDDVIGDIEIRLTRPAIVRGQVKDASGKAVVGREVRASAADKLENRYYDPTTTTDKNGSFELKFVRAGVQHIQVAPFWLNAEEAPAGTNVDVTLKDGEIKEGVGLQAKEPESRAVSVRPLAPLPESPPGSVKFTADAEVQRLIPLIRENEARYDSIEYICRKESTNHAFDGPAPEANAMGAVKTRKTELRAIYQGPCQTLATVERNEMPDGKMNIIKLAQCFDGKTLHSRVGDGPSETSSGAAIPNREDPFVTMGVTSRVRLSATLSGAMAELTRKAGGKGSVSASRLQDGECMGLACVVLQEEDILSYSKTHSRRRSLLWICPGRNDLPLRCELYETDAQGKETRTAVWEVKELTEISPGVYFPTKREGHWTVTFVPGHPWSQEERVVFEGVKLSPNYPASRFAALDSPTTAPTK